MATDFPVNPVDRLPIFGDEACSAAILTEMVQRGGPVEVQSGGGSRWGMEDGGMSGGVGISCQPAGGQLSGDAYREQPLLKPVEVPCQISTRVKDSMSKS